MGRLGVAFVALPAGGRKALPNSDMMPWFAGVCGLVLTTRRVCGLARLAVAIGRFFVAAGSALAGALTFGSARGSGFLAGTAIFAGEAGAGVSALGSVRATSGAFGSSAVAGLSSRLSDFRWRRLGANDLRLFARRLIDRRGGGCVRLRGGRVDCHRRGSSLPLAAGDGVATASGSDGSAFTSAGAGASGETCCGVSSGASSIGFASSLAGSTVRSGASAGANSAGLGWATEGAGSAIRLDRFGRGLDIGRRWSRLDRRGLVAQALLFHHRKRGGRRRVGLRFHRGVRCGVKHLNLDRRRRVAARPRQGNQHREHGRNTESVHGSGAKHAEWESNRASVSQRAQLQGRRRTFAPRPSLS